MKKHLSLLLCLLMLVSMFSVFTVQSSAAAVPVIWDFTDPSSVAALSSTGGAACGDLYIGAFRNTSSTGTLSGSVSYDASEKAVVLGTSGDGKTHAYYRPYMTAKTTSFKPSDYPYVKLRFKVESDIKNMSLQIRNAAVSGWPSAVLYNKNLPTGEWVEAVIDLSSTNWYSSAEIKPSADANNAYGYSWVMQLDAPSGAPFKDGDFTIKMQYVGFFATKAEADDYPSNPLIMTYDSPASVLPQNNTYAAAQNAIGYVNTYYWDGEAKTRGAGTTGFDAEENAAWFSAPADGSTIYMARAYMLNYGDAFKTQDYRYVKVRMKAETTANVSFTITLRTSDRVAANGYKDITVASGYKSSDGWIEKVIDLKDQAWYGDNYDVYKSADGSTSDEAFFVQFHATSTLLTNENFKGYIQYIGFFATEAEAKAYTYEKKDADPIVWTFDSPDAVPAYAADLNDAYVSYVNHDGTSAKVDFDGAEQAVFVTPDYTKANTKGNFMRIQFNNTGAAIKGEDYPYIKLRFKLDTDSADPYSVYFRTTSYSANTISYPAKTNEWVEVVVDMAAAHAATNKYLGWARSIVQTSSDAANWGLALQVENMAAAGDYNIFDEEDFRFYLQYIAFFATEEEANAFTFTPVQVPALSAVEMKLDTPNAVSSMTPDAANRAPFYASNFLMGDKNAAGGYPIGIMGYDEDERAVYFSPDYSQNGLYPNPYMSRIYISAKDATVMGENYRYMKIRYKLESDDPNVRVFLRDSKTWGSFDLFADKKTPVNEWVEVIVDMYKAGTGWTGKTVISPSNVMYLQLSNNNTAVNNFDESDYRIYLQYISFFQTKEEAEAYTYTPTNMDDLPNADDFKPTEKAIVMPFDLPKYSYNLAGNRFMYEYAIPNNGFSFGADGNGVIKFDEAERAIYTEAAAPLASATQARFVIRGSKQFSGADYPYVTICYKIENYEFGKNDYLTFRCGSAWTTIKLTSAPLVADQWVTATFNLNSMPGGTAWPNIQIGGSAGSGDYDLRLQLYLNKPGADNFTSNPDTRFYLKYIAFFQTKEDADAFQYTNWGVVEEDDSILNDPWLSVLARKYATKYAMTASCTEGGTISNIGDTQVKYKKDITYTITAAEGYTLTDVLVDGKSVGAVTEYTFESVKKPHTIHAVFTANAVEEGK